MKFDIPHANDNEAIRVNIDFDAKDVIAEFIADDEVVWAKQLRPTVPVDEPVSSGHVMIYSITPARRIAAIKFIRAFAKWYGFDKMGLKHAKMLVDDHINTGRPIDLGLLPEEVKPLIVMAASDCGMTTIPPNQRPLRIGQYDTEYASDIPVSRHI